MEAVVKIRLTVLCVLVLSSYTRAADEDAVKKRFAKNENYTVAWGEAPKYRADGELEIGSGNGHAHNLDWLRFVPGKDDLTVLSIRLRGSGGRGRANPDKIPEEWIVVERATMSVQKYQSLLDELAIAESAKLESVPRRFGSISTNDFWVSANLAAEKKTLLNREWAGYESGGEEVNFAKPRVMAQSAEAAIEKLAFKEHQLTATERAWVSTKFARDWKQFKDLESHWWVRERYIQIVTNVGDKSALPTLREILREPLPPKEKQNPSDARVVVAAIRAVDRILKFDRKLTLDDEKAVEAERKKTLELLKDVK